MHSIRFSDDRIVKRLRWVMLAVMSFSVINTLVRAGAKIDHVTPR